MLKVAVEGEAIELRPMHSLKEALTMDQVHYPDNLSMRNLAYFLVVPTLVYQTSYPQSSRFRARWVLWCGQIPQIACADMLTRNSQHHTCVFARCAGHAMAWLHRACGLHAGPICRLCASVCAPYRMVPTSCLCMHASAVPQGSLEVYTICLSMSARVPRWSIAYADLLHPAQVLCQGFGHPGAAAGNSGAVPGAHDCQ